MSSEFLESCLVAFGLIYKAKDEANIALAVWYYSGSSKSSCRSL